MKIERKRTPISIGQRFGRWTAVGSVEVIGGNRIAMMRCDCGTEKHVYVSALALGKSKSCGCLHREGLIARITKHGMLGTAIYRSWQAMLQRCNNPNGLMYRHYGGRGISVCPEWTESFEAFRHCMEPTWQPGLSLDRVNNEMGYGPDNCRWATQREQMYNRRITRWMDTPHGRMLVDDVVLMTGINKTTLTGRIDRGVTGEALLSKRLPYPKRRKSRARNHAEKVDDSHDHEDHDGNSSNDGRQGQLSDGPVHKGEHAEHDQ
jgi:hypothetical protein